MKKILLFMFSFPFFYCSAQTLTTKWIDDWSALSFSGFYDTTTGECANAPKTTAPYLWGINVGHSNQAGRHLNGQIVFSINTFPTDLPEVHLRSTNSLGEGVWAKIIHSKGDHAIDGKLKVKEIEVTINTGADYVFAESYNLRSLSKVEAFVKENKHLPEIPSEKHMQENGLSMNEFQIKLLQKIEELTLYVINQDKTIKEQGALLDKQNKLIENLQDRFDSEK